MKKIYLLVILLAGVNFMTKAEIYSTETGIASYYHDMFHGRLTANGEIFDQRKISAAHKSLPFGTIVKVTRQDNGHSITVRINDRGPYVKGRIIDLSKKAGEALGILNSGTTKVNVEILSMPSKSQFASQKKSAVKKVENNIAKPAPKVKEVSVIKEKVKSTPMPTSIFGSYEYKGNYDYNVLTIVEQIQDIVKFRFVAHNISQDKKIDFEGVAQDIKIPGIYTDENGKSYTMSQYKFMYDAEEYILSISKDFTKGLVHRSNSGNSMPKDNNVINLEVWLSRLNEE